MHLVGFIIRIYYDARSSECQSWADVEVVVPCFKLEELTVTKWDLSVAMADVVFGFVSRKSAFDPRPTRLWCVVDRLALGQVSSPEYFDFPVSVFFHQCSTLIHRRCVNKGKAIRFVADGTV